MSEKYPPPIAIATAMPTTATSESPGDLANIRSPSLTSSQDTFTNVRRASSARCARRTDVHASRTGEASPNRCAAASRAASGLMPCAM
jgi:hypothetical protein